jgi:hypothetical protein
VDTATARDASAHESSIIAGRCPGQPCEGLAQRWLVPTCYMLPRGPAPSGSKASSRSGCHGRQSVPRQSKPCMTERDGHAPREALTLARNDLVRSAIACGDLCAARRTPGSGWSGQSRQLCGLAWLAAVLSRTNSRGRRSCGYRPAAGLPAAAGPRGHHPAGQAPHRGPVTASASPGHRSAAPSSVGRRHGQAFRSTASPPATCYRACRRLRPRRSSGCGALPRHRSLFAKPRISLNTRVIRVASVFSRIAPISQSLYGRSASPQGRPSIQPGPGLELWSGGIMAWCGFWSPGTWAPSVSRSRVSCGVPGIS